MGAANHESVTTVGNWTTDERMWSGKGKKTGGKERARKAGAKGLTKATRAKDLEVPRVYLGLRTVSTAGNVEIVFTMHEGAEALCVVCCLFVVCCVVVCRYLRFSQWAECRNLMWIVAVVIFI